MIELQGLNSDHYLPPSREVEMTPDVYNTLVSELTMRKYHLKEGKTWTTDAFYRETKAKISMRGRCERR